MCLVRNSGSEFFFKLKCWMTPWTKWVKCYKVLQIRNNNKYYAPFYPDGPIESGWYESDRLQLTQKTELENINKEVENGIHVYTLSMFARSMVSTYDNGKNCHLIKCKALKKDFVAAGLFEVVFVKIWIPEKELEKHNVSVCK